MGRIHPAARTTPRNPPATKAPTRVKTISSTNSRSNRTKSGFTQFSLSAGIQRGIAEAGFSEPRPIQAKTIPSALQGRDILGLAQTGTGKTAAFALPLLERLLVDPRQERRGPRALVIAPTRELASQIQAEIKLLAHFTRLRTTTVFGGVGQGAQVRALASRPEVLVACPGRLLDLLKQGALRLDSVEVLVLDEADHMFDMGFLPDLRRILRALPSRRQNLLFSATMPKEIRRLADEVLNRPIVVELGHSAPAETIEHALYSVDSNDGKVSLLRHLLGLEDFTSAIVFLRTKHRAKRLALQLVKAGHNAVALQGNMSQGQRERAMEGFRSGRYDVLVATDIAARGIDVSGISHVINFDVPNTPDAYTHRIGRTGRSEKRGKAFTFVTNEDADEIRAIERRIGARIARLDLPSLDGKSNERRLPRPPKAPQRRARSTGAGTKPGSGRRNARPPLPAPKTPQETKPPTPFGSHVWPDDERTQRTKRRHP